jgi:hypothetical protein
MNTRKGGPWLHKWLPIVLVGLIAGVTWFCSAKIKLRRERVCLNNLRLIDGAVYNVAAEQKYQEGQQIPPGALTNYLPESRFSCPRGARYTIPVIGKRPICPVHGDLLAREVSETNSVLDLNRSMTNK